MHSPEYIRLMNDKEWRTLRADWLSDHRLCECCKRKGLVVAARCVHHVTPIESAKTDKQMKVLAYSSTNLMSLCFACHAEIHKSERSHSKEAHKQRQSERLERFKERIGKPMMVVNWISEL